MGSRLRGSDGWYFFPSFNAFSRKISGSAFQLVGRGLRAALFIS
jgi:hypothetical protein